MAKAHLQLQLQAANAKKQPAAADHSTAATARLLVVEEEANIANDGAAHQAGIINAGGSCFSCLPAFLAFFFLTLNSATAIVRSRGDAAAVTFVCFSYADLLALFLCLRMYERAPAGSNARSWLKVAVWVLTALLTIAFSGKVAAVMPVPMAVLVWLVAFATIAGGFVAFFLYQEKKGGPEGQSWFLEGNDMHRCQMTAG